MWETVFDKMVSRLIHKGRLRVTYPDGTERAYGPDPDHEVAISITDAATLRALCLRPELALGEAFMDDTLRVDGDIEDLLKLLIRNRDHGSNMPLQARALAALRYGLRRWLQRNSARRSRSNVAHHYDLSDAFYRLFLDADMQYSCAYFSDPDMTLEAAQEAKKAMIARKLRIEPGMRVLDIGCGWGGMALTLAGDFGAHVTGITLSENQLATARARARDAGLDRRIEFRLTDYRALSERFDRIVSVGMLEHVGAPNFGTYFGKVADLLAPDGVALIHTIASGSPPRAQSPWINKYIFPGGYIPALSELMPAVEGSGLWTADIEVWRLHYAMTLRHWRRRFEDRLDVVRKTHDDRFVRMWRFYLTACYVTFEEERQSVYQLQLAHDPQAVPLTRDYMYPSPGTGEWQGRQAAE